MDERSRVRAFALSEIRWARTRDSLKPDWRNGYEAAMCRIFLSFGGRRSTIEPKTQRATARNPK